MSNEINENTTTETPATETPKKKQKQSEKQIRLAGLFKEINSKIGVVRGRGRGPTMSRDRGLQLLKEVAQGFTVAKRPVKDGGVDANGKKVMEEYKKNLGPAAVADSVVKALRFGATLDDVKELTPNVGKLFPWENAREALMTLAKEQEVSLSDVAQAFGLEDEGTTVVASDEPEPEKKNAKASNAAKRSGRAHA